MSLQIYISETLGSIESNFSHIHATSKYLNFISTLDIL